MIISGFVLVTRDRDLRKSAVDHRDHAPFALRDIPGQCAAAATAISRALRDCGLLVHHGIHAWRIDTFGPI